LKQILPSYFQHHIADNETILSSDGNDENLNYSHDSIESNTSMADNLDT
jgi:hypothetical protein